MLRRIDKRGGIGDLVSLFTATIVIAMILVGFAVISAIVKEVAGDRSGEKIYNSTEVGVGDLREYMRDYNRLVMAEIEIGNGMPVDEALKKVKYGELPQDVSPYGSVGFEGGVYDR